LITQNRIKRSVSGTVSFKSSSDSSKSGSVSFTSKCSDSFTSNNDRNLEVQAEVKGL
jgi:hypothetical protein